MESNCTIEMWSFLQQAQVLKIANKLLQDGSTDAAYILYQYLEGAVPQFNQYKWLRQFAGRRLKRSGHSQPQNLRHELGELPANESELVRVLDILIVESEGVCSHTGAVIMQYLANSLPETHHKYALITNLHAREKYLKSWTDSINKFFGLYGMTGIATQKGFDFNTRCSGIDHIDFLPSDQTSPFADAMVTVFVSAYNAEETIDACIKSLITQTHRNLEIIIIDDGSKDSTFGICTRVFGHHPCIKLFRNDRSRGTYFNRNVGLEIALGEFFTVLDADDIAHPRRFEMQLSCLNSNSSSIGVIGNWIRIDPRGYISFRNAWGGTYLHEAVATFLFKTSVLRTRIGYWDEVMFAADTEYLERARRVFGQKSILTIRKPLCIASQISTSLTNNAATGIHKYSGLSDARKEYRKYWQCWHKQETPSDLYLDRNTTSRRFPAPKSMIPSINA